MAACEKPMTDEVKQLADRLACQYSAIRMLPDGSIATLLKLITTWAICLGINEFGYERRFCFKNKALALQRFAELQSEDDEPAGYVAKR
jgi:hypothetical protein